MLMVRLYSGNLSMVALGNVYHGGSVGTIGLTGLQMWKYPYPIPQVPHQTMQSEIHQVMNPDPYRGTFGSAAAYAKEIEEYITHGGSGRVAGFIAETFQGVGGAVELAHGYLKLAYDIVQKAGGVCIADEVRSVITMTLGIPDTRCHSRHCTNAKGIGNGLPFRAVLTTSEIASVLSQKMQFNTFGGNPVCSAGGLGVLKNCKSHCQRRAVRLTSWTTLASLQVCNAPERELDEIDHNRKNY